MKDNRISKKEFLARESFRYDKMTEGIKASRKIDKAIAKLRNRGFNVIVLGPSVRVSLPK